MKCLFLLLLLTCSCICYDLGYGENSLYDCSYHQFDGRPDRDELIEMRLSEINMKPVDAMLFVIFGPVAGICCLLLILSFIKYPELRKQPGDILLAISISELILSIHWTVSAARFFHDDNQPPKNKSLFCNVNAVVAMGFGSLEYYYNISFSAFLIFKIRHILKEKTIPKYVFHFLSIGIVLGVLLTLHFTGSFGKNIFGTCSMKVITDFPKFGSFVYLFYLFISIFTIWYFNKHVPKDPKFEELRNGYLNYYYKYILAVLVIWGIQSLSTVISENNCDNIHNTNLLFFITLCNAAKLCSPAVLSILRVNDPFLRRKVKKIRKMLFKRVITDTILLGGNQDSARSQSDQGIKTFSMTDINNENGQLGLPGGLNNNLLLPSGRPETVNREGERDSIDSVTGDKSHEQWISEIRENMKIMLIYTMITGIVLNNTETKGRRRSFFKRSQEKETNFKPAAFAAKTEYKITEKLIGSKIPDVSKELNSTGFKVKPCKMTAYASEVFNQLLVEDKDMIHLETSLSLLSNIENIKKAGKADGGRGGEFFFFSYDNKLIIKTMSEQELEQMLMILTDYYGHYQNNPHSLIAKIYGLYRFQMKENFMESNTYILLLMRNVGIYPRKYIERVFDLKGSTDDREVLAKFPDANLMRTTLKDIDFKKLEQKININEEMSNRVAETLIKDAQFLADKELMDYSLILLKINRARYYEENSFEASKMIFKFTSPLYSIESITEPGFVYHIGIIDYLQLWNMKKFAENLTKKVIMQKRDPSAMEPKKYKERFCRFIYDILNVNSI